MFETLVTVVITLQTLTLKSSFLSRVSCLEFEPRRVRASATQRLNFSQRWRKLQPDPFFRSSLWRGLLETIAAEKAATYRDEVLTEHFTDQVNLAA